VPLLLLRLSTPRAPPRRPLASVAGVTADGQRPMVQDGALAANNHLHQPPNGGARIKVLKQRLVLHPRIRGTTPRFRYTVPWISPGVSRIGMPAHAFHPWIQLPVGKDLVDLGPDERNINMGD
jgi:hypothetical protein